MKMNGDMDFSEYQNLTMEKKMDYLFLKVVSRSEFRNWKIGVSVCLLFIGSAGAYFKFG